MDKLSASFDCAHQPRDRTILIMTYFNKKKKKKKVVRFAGKRIPIAWCVDRGIGVSQGTKMNSVEMVWIGNLWGMKMNWERLMCGF